MTGPGNRTTKAGIQHAREHFRGLTQILGAVSVVKGDASIDIAAGSQISARDFKADASVYADVKAVASYLCLHPRGRRRRDQRGGERRGHDHHHRERRVQDPHGPHMNVVADTSAVKGFAVAVAVSVIVSDANTVISDTAVLNVGGDLYVTATTWTGTGPWPVLAGGRMESLPSISVTVEDGDTNAFLDGEPMWPAISMSRRPTGDRRAVGKLLIIPSQAIGTSGHRPVWAASSKGDFLDDAQVLAATSPVIGPIKSALSGFISKAQNRSPAAATEVHRRPILTPNSISRARWPSLSTPTARRPGSATAERTGTH
jgi:hypothetical protein